MREVLGPREALRFAAVLSHPIQHYSPIFRELEKQPGVDVRVFYICDHGVRLSYDPGFGTTFAWDIPLLEGYEHEILRHGFSPRNFGFIEMDAPTLPSRLDAFRPHIIWIHGYGQRCNWRALLWAKGRASVLHFGDSELVHHRRWWVRVAKQFVVRWFFSRCDAFLSVGDNNEAYYRHYGVPPERIFRGACPVDAVRFRQALEATGRPTRDETRGRFEIPKGAFVALAVGKLESIKRPLDLVDAVAEISLSKGPAVHALFVGDGPLRGALEERARTLGVAERVHIAGFVNQTEIPLAIETGDVLVAASERDAHPLSVTEALIAGLPAVVSDRVGCVGPTDTARPGVNAIVYPCGDTAALAEALARLAGDDTLRSRMAVESRRIAQTQDVHVTVEALLRIFAICVPGAATAQAAAVGLTGP